jgi:SAM-dependent methyltransferase
VNVDQGKLDALMGKLIGNMTGGMVCLGMWIGDELGLYRALAGSGPLSADSVAKKAGCNARLVREWLDGQVAAGFVEHDAPKDTYELGAEAAMALADDSSPVFVARAMPAFGSMFIDMPKILAAFKGNGAMSWGEHHAGLFCGTEWFFRTGYRALLATTWIPALGGVEEKLKAGAKIADIGCGHGASAVVMAEAYPKSTIHGFDFHPPSIETSRKRAEDAGVADRAKFEVATAKTYPGTYDLICFFDCLHDMGDPVGAARYARERLAEGGTVLLVEPFAHDGRTKNTQENPMATLLYLASSCICTPNSLSQEVGLGLGAQAGEARLRGIFEEAGFKQFKRAAETPMNLIFDIKA